MEDFHTQMEADEMPFEVIKECTEIMNNLEVKTLNAVRLFLKSVAG